MELTIHPNACTEQIRKDKETGEERKVPPVFEPGGKVVITLPTTPVQYRFKAKYGKRWRDHFKGREESDVDPLEMMELLADVIEDIMPHLKSVDLVSCATKQKIDTVDQFVCDEECQSVISEIALKFIFGFAEKN